MCIGKRIKDTDKDTFRTQTGSVRDEYGRVSQNIPTYHVLCRRSLVYWLGGECFVREDIKHTQSYSTIILPLSLYSGQSEYLYGFKFHQFHNNRRGGPATCTVSPLPPTAYYMTAYTTRAFVPHTHVNFITPRGRVSRLHRPPCTIILIVVTIPCTYGYNPNTGYQNTSFNRIYRSGQVK